MLHARGAYFVKVTGGVTSTVEKLIALEM